MIVLAGGIGSGKSMIARILRLRRLGVFDCDFEARLLMENDIDLVAKIKKIAGEDVYTNGKLNRKRLASMIFNDCEIRNRINETVHSAVRKRVKSWLKENSGNLFVETAIAAESGLAAMARQIWIVEASDKTRLARVKARDDREEDEIRKIMCIQRFEEEKLKNFSIPIKIIPNNPSDSLLITINDLLNEIEFY